MNSFSPQAKQKPLPVGKVADMEILPSVWATSSMVPAFAARGFHHDARHVPHGRRQVVRQFPPHSF